MRKSNLLGGALLLAALFVNTSCKEIFGNMDLSGDTTVSSYVAINTATKTAAPAEEFTLSITKIGDGTVTWSSSDPAIAEVQGAGLSAKVITKKSGDATITANVAAAGNYQAGSAKCAVAVRVKTGEQLVNEVANASTSEATTIYLDGSANIALTDHLDMKDKEIVIEGNNATISTGKRFLISKSFTLQNAKIDITENTNQLIALDSLASGATKKNVEVYTDAGTKGANLIDEITLKNVWVKNLHNSLIDAMNQAWALTTLNIENCIIQLDYNTTKTVIDFYRVKDNKGSIKNINVKNNTFINLQSAAGYFFRFKHASTAAAMFGTSNGTSTFDWNVSNNTFIRTMAAKDFGNNMVNNAKVTNTVSNNLFYDVYRVYQFLQNNQTRTTVGNYIYYDAVAVQGNDQSRTDNNGNPYTTKLTSAPFTAPTAAIDLTKANGGLNLTPSGDAAAAGDPRWIK
jgi:hypothetical protein